MSIVSVTVSSMSNLLSDYRINLPRGKHIEEYFLKLTYIIDTYSMVSIKLPVLLSILVQIFPSKVSIKRSGLSQVLKIKEPIFLKEELHIKQPVNYLNFKSYKSYNRDHRGGTTYWGIFLKLRPSKFLSPYEITALNFQLVCCSVIC